MFNTAAPTRLTSDVVYTATMYHAVNPVAPCFTRCHRRTDSMSALDQARHVHDPKRLICRVCHLEEQKASGQAYRTDALGHRVPHVEGGVGYARGMATTTLTPRQQQVLDLWLDGKTYKEVAAECGISPETVNPHLKAVRKKLNATGISRDALRKARG